MSRIGRDTAREYGVRLIPALLVFDGHGQVIEKQIGVFNAEQVLTAIEAGTNAK